MQEELKVYPYRWVVLFSFMCVIAAQNMMWVTFAPITKAAAEFFKVSDIGIGFLSMIFMITYIIVSIPASWVIDTYGLKVGVGIGAILTGVFGLTRGLFAADYNLVLISQIGISLGQPFISNAVTTLACRWFPVEDRATASGVGILAGYLGVIFAMIETPYITMHFGIEKMLLIYGIAALACGLLFLIFGKERPLTPPAYQSEERSLALDGLKQIMKSRDFLLLLGIFLIGLGVFNGMETWIEDILKPRGFSMTQAGITGGVIVICGILGAIVIPMISDRKGKRRPIIIFSIAACIPGLIGITFAANYLMLLIAAGVFGFFMLGVGPLGFQYGAEITYPAPEAASNGMLMLAGQVTGILFIYGMDMFKNPITGSMTLPLIAIIGLMVVNLIITTMLHESKIINIGANGQVGGQPSVPMESQRLSQ
ncbi:MAG: MFS transporter [Chitinophagales bacterium]